MYSCYLNGSSLCFACGGGPGCPCRPEGVAGGCAVGLWAGLCAVDSGNDGFGGCKAHGCGLLVKRAFSGQPSLCFRGVVVCCHSSVIEEGDECERKKNSCGLDLIGYCYKSLVLQFSV